MGCAITCSVAHPERLATQASYTKCALQLKHPFTNRDKTATTPCGTLESRKAVSLGLFHPQTSIWDCVEHRDLPDTYKHLSSSTLLKQLHRPNTPSGHYYARKHIRTCFHKHLEKTQNVDTPTMEDCTLKEWEYHIVAKSRPNASQTPSIKNLSCSDIRPSETASSEQPLMLREVQSISSGLTTRNRFSALEEVDLSKLTLETSSLRKRMRGKWSSLPVISSMTRCQTIEEQRDMLMGGALRAHPSTTSGGSDVEEGEIQEPFVGVNVGGATPGTIIKDPILVPEWKEGGRVSWVNVEKATKYFQHVEVPEEIVTQRLMPPHKNASSGNENVLYDVDENRPFFYPEVTATPVADVKTSDGKNSITTERSLVAHLQVEVAFMSREPKLLQMLLQRAKRYLAQYDCSQITPEAIRDLVIGSVAAAYIPSLAEQHARRFLTDRRNACRVAVHNEFLKGEGRGLLRSYTRKWTANILGDYATLGIT